MRRQVLFVLGNQSKINRVDRFSEESNQSKKGRLIDKVDRVDRPFRQVDRWRRLGRFRGLISPQQGSRIYSPGGGTSICKVVNLTIAGA